MIFFQAKSYCESYCERREKTKNLNIQENLSESIKLESEIKEELKQDKHPGIYPPIQPDIEDWPIHKLSQNKEEFLETLVNDTVEILIEQFQSLEAMEEELAKVVFLENIRLEKNPWKVDTKDEKEFWKKAKRTLLKRSLKQKDDPDFFINYDNQIFYDICRRYCTEIIGNFEKDTYQFASKALPIGFNRLLNTASNRNMKRIWNNEFELTDRVKPFGYIDEVRELAKKGTIILLPTHHSNLDSILIGWAIHCLGLPAMQYGAGLNLFNNPLMRYFFNRLGAYKIDRRKKNSIYMECLKNYSRLSVGQGLHTLFFAGGTRSRSGQLESKLKLGLLGTVLDALRANFDSGDPTKPTKIICVPMVLSYHFVLEAPNLIHQFLKKEGQEKYFVRGDSIPGFRKLTKFVWKFFSRQSEVLISLGKPMDLFGNDLDSEGNSIDKNGKSIDIKKYFMSDGKITKDIQRDSEYTRMLGEHLKERFYRENIVLSSHLIAFAAFEILNKKFRKLDLYGLLRLAPEDRVIPYQHFIKVIESLRERLIELEKNNQVRLSRHIYRDPKILIMDGLRNMDIYSAKSPLIEDKNGDITSEDMNLLYFYHNRMKGYNLEQYV